MNKAEQNILASRTPEAYVDSSLKSNLSPARKAALAREWMRKTGFTRQDILYARNRHPHWKMKKMENSAERAQRRLELHDYSRGKAVTWTAELVERFLDLSASDGDGHYEHRDCDLARLFKTTIPSIQYMRRKLKLVRAILGARASKAKLVEYLGRSEALLKQGRQAVERFVAREADRNGQDPKPAPRARRAAPKKAAARKAAKR